MATSAVIFRTPGLIPIEAFTTHGINVKPNTKNPIGFFGTGLKYSVAVLLRHGITIRVFSGKTEYEFYLKKQDFRGVDFDWVMMKKRKSLTGRWGATQLSYTTQYGKNWDLWQVVRELVSNTRDENGEVVVLNHENYEENIQNYNNDESLIIIEDDTFTREYLEQVDKVFLPIASLELRDKSERLEIYNQPGKHIYYKGLRVYDLETPSIYTYNIVRHMDLTEDRTLKYLFEARQTIAQHISRSKDEKLIHSVVGAEDKFFEHKVDYDFVYESPSKEFMEAVKVRRQRNLPLTSFAGTYYGKYSPAPRTPIGRLPLHEQWERLMAEGQVPEALKPLVVKTIEKLRETLAPVKAETDEGVPF